MALAGYLANLDSVPPLVFRFQINPTVLSEKRSFKYTQVQALPSAAFDRASARTQGETGAGWLTSGISGVLEDAAEWGALLTSTKPLRAQEGDPRVIELEFDLDASWVEPNGRLRWGSGTIEPDLELLRAFVNPAVAITDLTEVLQGNVQDRWKPPEVSLKYGHVSMSGVMTDLNIKIVAFQADGAPQRATVTAVVKEQTKSLGAVGATVGRLLTTGKALLQTPFDDVVAASPVGRFVD